MTAGRSRHSAPASTRVGAPTAGTGRRVSDAREVPERRAERDANGGGHVVVRARDDRGDDPDGERDEGPDDARVRRDATSAPSTWSGRTEEVAEPRARRHPGTSGKKKTRGPERRRRNARRPTNSEAVRRVVPRFCRRGDGWARGGLFVVGIDKFDAISPDPPLVAAPRRASRCRTRCCRPRSGSRPSRPRSRRLARPRALASRLRPSRVVDVASMLGAPRCHSAPRSPRRVRLAPSPPPRRSRLAPPLTSAASSCDRARRRGTWRSPRRTSRRCSAPRTRASASAGGDSGASSSSPPSPRSSSSSRSCSRASRRPRTRACTSSSSGLCAGTSHVLVPGRRAIGEQAPVRGARAGPRPPPTSSGSSPRGSR